MYSLSLSDINHYAHMCVWAYMLGGCLLCAGTVVCGGMWRGGVEVRGTREVARNFGFLQSGPSSTHCGKEHSCGVR